MRRTAAVAVVVGGALVLAACGGGGGGGSGGGATTSTASADAAGLDDVTFTLTEVATLEQPLAMAVREGVDGFYVAEKGGRVRHVASPGASPTTVLDISDDVSTGNEQGLLGIAISPDGTTLYASFTDTDGDSRVVSYPFTGDTTVGDGTELFTTDQPYDNHNGGNIGFGPDGFLWLGLGDGGAGGDPEGRAQDMSTVLGKLLRFDVSSRSSAPPEPQIWASGLRNPWRWSFDRENGDIWIGDVGQDDWEEIDRASSSDVDLNFGWDLLEGTHPFEQESAPDTVMPVFEYGHDEGQSIVGGYVYRGSAVPGLVGTYLFSDTYAAELRALRIADDGTVSQRALGIDVPGGNVASFGEDAEGELYVLSLSGGIYRIDPRNERRSLTSASSMRASSFSASVAP